MSLHVKADGTWREIGGGGSSGGPGWDVLTVTPTGPDAVLSWPAAGGAASYEISVNDETTDVGNVLTHTLSSLPTMVEHTFRVRPKNADGLAGGWSNEVRAVITGWNEATGGTVNDVTNYNGTGETWRVHRFTGNGTFTITRGALPFRALVVGGGGGGVGNTGAVNGQAGNGATGADTTIPSFDPGAHPITVGGGGGGSSPSHSVPGHAAGASSGLGLTGPGAGGPGGGGGGWNRVSNITGANVTYGQSAPGPSNGATGGRGNGGGGGMCSVNNCGGAAGSAGISIFAYRIG
jgi:hypothetical protein